MKTIIDRVMRSMRHFTVVDITLFKLCLLAFGILLGHYLAPFFDQHIYTVWGVAMATYILLMARIWRYMKKGDDC